MVRRLCHLKTICSVLVRDEVNLNQSHKITKLKQKFQTVYPKTKFNLGNDLYCKKTFDSENISEVRRRK
jgi:hypothetical protein